ncbi:MAG: DUF1553 domain-containing protein [Planctomycetes bacterium]|nr:DUF1553 domain-containing protein [Planctomycetota bacterium]
MHRCTLSFAAMRVASLSVSFIALCPLPNPSGAGTPDNVPLENAAARWAADGPGGTPDFTRHVVPLLGKLGCNNRACHGSFQGQNGFRLSLFGHDAGMDHAELTKDEGEGPRVNVADVDQSLALRKPGGIDDHEGGLRMEPGSWQFRLFRQWIAAGAQYDPKVAPRIDRVEITPAEIILDKSTRPTAQLRLVAHFTDGAAEDMTPLTLFSSNDDAVAKVTDGGEISLAGAGDTAIVATYAGVVITSQVIVPSNSGKTFPDFPANNRVDEFVAAKLRKVGIHPSELATDEEFLRRMYLDLIGTLPTAEKAWQFLGDASPDKRTRLIDELLQRPEYAMYWATATSREGRSAKEYLDEYQALKTALRDGFDSDTYVRRRSNDMFYKKATNGNAETVSLQMAYSFLGLRLECAQCHKHPFDRWTQNDFKRFTAFFNVVNRGQQPDLKEMAPDKPDRTDLPLVEVFVSDRKQSAKPKLLGGDEVDCAVGDDPREALWQWMRSADNPYFGQAIANRLWGHYFGVGIVDPVDDFNAANPPSNPQLLTWLAKDFVAHGFDLKHLHRTILNSRTYQLSWRPNETNQLDERNFSHALLRRMPAEVVLDAINQITGGADRYAGADAPQGTRTINLAPTRLRGNGPEYALGIFGRPLRTQLCDCERSSETGLAQALYLLNDVELNSKLADPRGQLARLLKEIPDNARLIEELYLTALARYPREEEMQKGLAFVAASQSREAGMQDVLWSLVNLREFIFVH